MTDAKLRRAVWLLAQALLQDNWQRAVPAYEEAKRLASVEVHEYEGISGSAQGCTHRYMNSKMCGKDEIGHPLGLEPDGKTK